MRYWNPVWISKETTEDDRTTHFISLRHDDANESDLLRTRYVFEESKSLIKICIRGIFVLDENKQIFFEKWPFGEKLQHELLEAHLVTAGASLVLGDNGDMQCPHNWLNWGSWLESEIVASWQYFVTDLKTQQYRWSGHCCCDQCGKKAISRQIQLLCNWNCSQTDEENASLRFH